METLQQSKNLTGNKVSRKEIILKEATQLFRTKGYPLTSVRDLAQEVGIEASSIYSHFKSKEHILKHICFEMAASFITGLERAETQKTPEQKLQKAIKEHIQVVLMRKEASMVMWNEWRYLTEPAYKQFQTMVRDYEKGFRNIIDEGIRGRAFKNMDAAVVTNLILSSLNNLGYWHKNESRSVNEIEKEFIDIYFKGILN